MFPLVKNMRNQSSKPNVIYLAGTGRCGSTLLDMLLNTHPDVVTAGEIQIWPHELLLGGKQDCGCGKTIPDCPFWQEMLKAMNPLEQVSPQIHHFREAHNAGSNLRWPHIQYIRKGQVPAEVQTQAEVYGSNNQELFNTYTATWTKMYGQPPQWIVDASKDPYRLYWLAISGKINLKVLHIIRYPQSYTYSMTKGLVHGNDAGRLLKLPFVVIRKALGWIINNRTIEMIGERFVGRENYCLVRYEDLAREPDRTMDELGAFIGLSAFPQASAAFRATEMHTISGNPMRLENKKVQLDEKWKKNLPGLYQQLVGWITAPYVRHFGYKAGR